MNTQNSLIEVHGFLKVLNSYPSSSFTSLRNVISEPPFSRYKVPTFDLIAKEQALKAKEPIKKLAVKHPIGVSLKKQEISAKASSTTELSKPKQPASKSASVAASLALLKDNKKDSQKSEGSKSSSNDEGSSSQIKAGVVRTKSTLNAAYLKAIAITKKKQLDAKKKEEEEAKKKEELEELRAKQAEALRKRQLEAFKKRQAAKQKAEAREEAAKAKVNFLKKNEPLTIRFKTVNNVKLLPKISKPKQSSARSKSSDAGTGLSSRKIISSHRAFSVDGKKLLSVGSGFRLSYEKHNLLALKSPKKEEVKMDDRILQEQINMFELFKQKQLEFEEKQNKFECRQRKLLLDHKILKEKLMLESERDSHFTDTRTNLSIVLSDSFREEMPESVEDFKEELKITSEELLLESPRATVTDYPSEDLMKTQTKEILKREMIKKIAKTSNLKIVKQRSKEALKMDHQITAKTKTAKILKAKAIKVPLIDLKKSQLKAMAVKEPIIKSKNRLIRNVPLIGKNVKTKNFREVEEKMKVLSDMKKTTNDQYNKSKLIKLYNSIERLYDTVKKRSEEIDWSDQEGSVQVEESTTPRMIPRTKSSSISKSSTPQSVSGEYSITPKFNATSKESSEPRKIMSPAAVSQQHRLSFLEPNPQVSYVFNINQPVHPQSKLSQTQVIQNSYIKGSPESAAPPYNFSYSSSSTSYTGGIKEPNASQYSQSPFTPKYYDRELMNHWPQMTASSKYIFAAPTPLRPAIVSFGNYIRPQTTPLAPVNLGLQNYSLRPSVDSSCTNFSNPVIGRKNKYTNVYRRSDYESNMNNADNLDRVRIPIKSLVKLFPLEQKSPSVCLSKCCFMQRQF